MIDVILPVFFSFVTLQVPDSCCLQRRARRREGSWGHSSLKFPDLRVAKSYISRIGVVFREDADLARFVGRVIDSTDVLLIDVEVDIASTGNDCKEIAVTHIFMDGRTIAVG